MDNKYIIGGLVTAIVAWVLWLLFKDRFFAKYGIANTTSTSTQPVCCCGTKEEPMAEEPIVDGGVVIPPTEEPTITAEGGGGIPGITEEPTPVDEPNIAPQPVENMEPINPDTSTSLKEPVSEFELAVKDGLAYADFNEKQLTTEKKMMINQNNLESGSNELITALYLAG